jgi:uncharacterized protein DUF2325
MAHGSVHQAATAPGVQARPPGRALRIGIVGGVERAQPLYERVATRAGHRLEYHSGHTSSRGGSSSLESLVRRVDLLLIITDVNSHRAVQLARQVAEAHGREHWVLKRCGPARFAELLGEVAAVA